MRLNPSLIVIYGATGDLTKRKLLPALYKLFAGGEINEHHPILCIARRNYSREEFLAAAEPEKFIRPTDAESFARFKQQIYYRAVNFDECTAAEGVHCGACDLQQGFVHEIEERHQTDGNRIFYLATPPDLFESISYMVKKCGLLEGAGFKRIAFEKPFGTSLDSARHLNRTLAGTFKESQIYRIDHYLGKALVQDILTFRFANTIFEKVWDRNSIDNIQITVSESLGVENRGGYYDKSGAIRDMLQNHLMELFALTAMERPASADPEHIRDAKTAVVEQLVTPRSEDFVIAQYEAGELKNKALTGYRDEPNVGKSSRTETYVALRAYVENERWRGVPFYLRTGKRLAESFAEIDVELKMPAQHPFEGQANLKPNLINIRIQPDTGISLTFNAKTPGLKGALTPVVMDFCHHCLFAMNTPEAYEALLQGILLGDQTIFTRWDSVESSWHYIDQLLALAADKELSFYPAGSTGPHEADDLLEKHGHHWLNASFEAPMVNEVNINIGDRRIDIKPRL
jgi:glucose-6-phosphate 1-dehydrogenase